MAQNIIIYGPGHNYISVEKLQDIHSYAMMVWDITLIFIIAQDMIIYGPGYNYISCYGLMILCGLMTGWTIYCLY